VLYDGGVRDAIQEQATHAPGGNWPVDRLLLGTLAALALVAAAAQPRPAPALLLFGVLALFVVAAARLGPATRQGRVVHAFGPLAVVVGIYESVGFLAGAVNPTRWDATFAALDGRLFGPLVPAWRGVLGRPPWLCDLLSACYFSYYLVPLAMAVALYLDGRHREHRRFVFAVVATLLATYAGYFLCPTSGPRVPAADAQAVLGGGLLASALRVFIARFELNALDAFPSGHTSLSVVFLALGWKLFPRWRAPLALTVGGIVYSTVFLSHHYLVDVVAGALLGLGLLPALPYAERALDLRRRLAWLSAKGESPS
jgi:membrane-associated phospholipid phosphatase